MMNIRKIKNLFRKFTLSLLRSWKLFIVPIIALIYGFGDIYHIWDDLSGRTATIICLDKMLNGDGYPEAWIFYNEKEFEPLIKRIKKHTNNDILKTSFNNGYFHYVISIEGSLIQRSTAPDDYFPQKYFIPSYSYVMVGYKERTQSLLDSIATGKVLKTFEGYAGWACRAEELRLWIQDERSRERFWVSIALLSILSIIISLKKKNVNN